MYDSLKKQNFVFPCNQWLSSSEGDKQLCRELICQNSSSPNDHRDRRGTMTDERESGRAGGWEISVVTGDKREAGTQHHAWIIVNGKREQSKQLWLENSSRKKILRR